MSWFAAGAPGFVPPELGVEPAPVSEHEDIRVQTQFTPPATKADWRDQRGIQMWELPLAPNQTQRFQAIYKVSVPKDANVPNLP